jgi:hypothetical protein
MRLHFVALAAALALGVPGGLSAQTGSSSSADSVRDGNTQTTTAGNTATRSSAGQTTTTTTTSTTATTTPAAISKVPATGSCQAQSVQITRTTAEA